MASTKNHIASLPAICSVDQFELFAKEALGILHIQKQLIVDFRLLRWIPTLPISLLFEIAYIGSSRKLPVCFDLHKCEDEKAIRLLRRIGFFSEAKALGVEIRGEKTLIADQGLAAFRSFKSRGELLNYERALASHDKWPLLLGGGTDIDFIRDGDFRDIILRVLHGIEWVN